MSKYIPTGWDFYQSFQMNNKLKLVAKPCIYQEIENIEKDEEKVNSFLIVNKSYLILLLRPTITDKILWEFYKVCLKSPLSHYTTL